jgi:very-short-patch-repair endonuclease
MLQAQGGIAHVTVPVAGGRASREGVRIHRSPSLTRFAVAARDNIPVTRPGRTLRDVRGSLTEYELGAAIRAAEVAGLPLDDFDPYPHLPESALEQRFLKVCRDHGVPRPETQVRVGRYRVDFLWRAERLIVEVDGYRYHGGRVAFERDRARDNALTALGYEVLRFTHRQLTDDPAAVAALVASRLVTRSR